MGAFTKLFSRLRITSDPNVATQTSAVIQADSGNTNLVIAPSGTGALVAQIPDGTATGGNARGTNAVDLQISRANANEVASGQQSVIIGGYNNRASGIFSMAGGGQNIATNQYALCLGGGFNTSSGGFSTVTGGSGNTASSNFATVSGGESNTASSGSWSTVGGGSTNTASSSYSTISGGQSNTASTNTHATVVGGSSNTSSGQYALSGGSNSTASGSRAIAIGESAVATGSNSVCIGGGLAQGVASTALAGAGNNAVKDYSLAQGYVTESQLRGQVAFSGTAFTFPSERGYCQQSLLTANREATLTTGGTTTLSLDGTGTTNLIIPFGNNRSWNVKINYVAVVTLITGTATGVTVGDTKSQNIEIGFKRVGGTSSLVGAGSYSIAQEDASMNSATLVPNAGGSQQLALTFTAPTFAGGGSVTCRVVAKVELVEVAW